MQNGLITSLAVVHHTQVIWQNFKQDSALQTGHMKQLNFFACNLTKCVPILKILSPANRMIIL